MEYHSIDGGLGSIVSEVAAGAELGTPVYRHGIHDVFTESGTPAKLEKAYELDAGGDNLSSETFLPEAPPRSNVHGD